MNAHTPGPWVVFKLRLSGMFVIGKPVDERTDAQGDGLAMADTEADARMIAAAPDMLDFAALIIHYNDKIRVGKTPTQGQWEMFVDRARALTAKAVGAA